MRRLRLALGHAFVRLGFRVLDSIPGYDWVEDEDQPRRALIYRFDQLTPTGTTGPRYMVDPPITTGNTATNVTLRWLP